MNQFMALKEKFILTPNGLSPNEYKILLSGKVDATLFYEIKLLLKSGKVDINKFIEIILLETRTDEHLLLLSLCFRNGGNPNIYIQKNSDILHILTYIYLADGKYTKLNDERIKNTLILMLLLFGSNPKLPYNKNGNINNVDFLNSLKVNNILTINPRKDINKVDKELILKLAILTDDVSLIPTDTINFPIVEIIRDDAINIFKKYHHIICKYDKTIEYSIKFINLKMFSILLNLGIYPTYHEINIIILSSIYQEINLKEEYINFINEYLKRNGNLDNYQRGLLDTYKIKVEAPQGQKQVELIGNCLLDDNYIPKEVDYIKKKYLYKKNFGIDERILITHVKENCLDIYKYEDMILTSDMYDDILSTRKVPFKDIILKDEILDAVSQRRGLLKRLGYKINNDNRRCVDEEYYKRQERAFIEIIRLHRAKDVSLLPLGEIQRILASLYINIDLLNYLSFEHYRRTFYISCYEKLIKNFDEVINLI